MARSSKTDKVLGLIGSEKPPASPASNPVLKPPEREAVPPVFVKSDTGTQFVNIPFLLINEQIGSIMERFRCCTCDECVSAVTGEVLKNLPAKIVRVRRVSDTETVDRAAAAMRSEAIRVITKAVMLIKTNPIH